MAKIIRIQKCTDCPFYYRNPVRIIKGNDMYWLHTCKASNETILEEEHGPSDISIFDTDIPKWCKLENE